MRKTKESFYWIVGILEKNKVPYRISGGFAARIYGSKRKLADIDIEIPDKNFRKILPEIKKYVLKGPNKYKDKNWDIYALSLKYNGQEIGLTGNNGKIFNKRKNKWVEFKANFSNINRKKIYGKSANFITKKDLINYKNKLRRRVDIKDIKEIS